MEVIKLKSITEELKCKVNDVSGKGWRFDIGIKTNLPRSFPHFTFPYSYMLLCIYLSCMFFHVKIL